MSFNRVLVPPQTKTLVPYATVGFVEQQASPIWDCGNVIGRDT
jgi:hypothetical protein